MRVCPPLTVVVSLLARSKLDKLIAGLFCRSEIAALSEAILQVHQEGKGP